MLLWFIVPPLVAAHTAPLGRQHRIRLRQPRTGQPVAVASVLGLDPPWLAQTRRSLAEARYRAGGVLAEFGDWLRLGR